MPTNLRRSLHALAHQLAGGLREARRRRRAGHEQAGEPLCRPIFAVTVDMNSATGSANRPVDRWLEPDRPPSPPAGCRTRRHLEAERSSAPRLSASAQHSSTARLSPETTICPGRCISPATRRGSSDTASPPARPRDRGSPPSSPDVGARPPPWRPALADERNRLAGAEHADGRERGEPPTEWPTTTSGSIRPRAALPEWRGSSSRAPAVAPRSRREPREATRSTVLQVEPRCRAATRYTSIASRHGLGDLPPHPLLERALAGKTNAAFAHPAPVVPVHSINAPEPQRETGTHPCHRSRDCASRSLPSARASASANGSADDVLPKRSTLTTVRSGGHPASSTASSMIRLFASCGT